MSYRLILEGLADERHAVTEKRNEYRKYIDKHRSDVLFAYSNFLVPALKGVRSKQVQDALKAAGSNIINHDLSKYEEIEFEAYRRHWYPTDFESNDTSFCKDTDGLYKIAWEHHHRVNQHHPEHWYLDKERPSDMPMEFIIEMLCDWWSVGRSNNNSVFDWWKSDKSNKSKIMTDMTLYKLNLIIGVVEEQIDQGDIEGYGWV